MKWSIIHLLPLIGLLAVKVKPGDQKENIARGKPTKFAATASIQTSDLAVDGDPNTFALSVEQTTPTWRVDLQRAYRVEAVSITNRKDCCAEKLSGAQIHVGFTSTGMPRCAMVSTVPLGETYTYSCHGMKGRYVSVFIPGTGNQLALAEVQVFGKPAAFALVPRQYHYVSDRKTWSEAQTHCREKYTDLATVRDSSDMQSLNELILNHSISDSAWIGLYNNVHNWGSQFEKLCQSSTDCDSCVYFYSGGGTWMSQECYGVLNLVCRDEGYSSPYGFLIIDHQKKTWTEAQRYCQQNQVRLATVRDQAESDFLKTSSRKSMLYMDPYGEGWLWSDGRKLTFINWVDSKLKYLNSSKRCAASMQTSSTQGGWETQSCTERLSFFCYSEPVMKRQIVRVDLKVNSHLDLSNTARQDEVLDQIRVKLQEKGLPADAKLSWRKQPDGQIFHEKKSKKRENQVRRDKDEF